MLCPKCGAGNSKRATDCSQCNTSLASAPEVSIYTRKERKTMHPSHEYWRAPAPTAPATPAHVSVIIADLKHKLGGPK